MVSASPSPVASLSKTGTRPHSAPSSHRSYRLVDQEGDPHPVLDDTYDSLDAAWSEALAWWEENGQGQVHPAIGVEVSTTSGCWRTVRAPGS
jgi:hypothetical protein